MFSRRPTITRRDCARVLVAAALPASASKARTLENDRLRFELSIDSGAVTERRFANRISGRTFSLRAPLFELEFDNGVVLSASQFQARLAAATAERLEFLFERSASPMSGLDVRVEYSLPTGKPYVRKTISLRQRPAPGARLLRADLEDARGVERAWQSMRADRLPYGSHPIFCEDTWAGVEFVAAFNQYSKDGFLLRSRPGGKAVAEQWLTLHSTMIGAAAPGRVRDAFLRATRTRRCQTSSAS